MKKKLITILLCVVMILGMIGCEKLKNEFEVGSKSNIQISQKDVLLSIKDGTLTNTSATLVLKNDSNKVLRYDEVYEIEIKQKNEWHKINAEQFFNAPLWELDQKQSKNLELKWKHGYGKLIRGEYRIIKEVYFEQESEQKFYVSAEFTIE